MDTTTIQITKDQAQELQDMKTHDDESYKSVIARFLEGDNSAIDAEEIGRQVSKQLDYSQLSGQIADELEGRM